MNLLVKMYFSGLIVVLFLSLCFMLIESHIDCFISYSYPLGYILLILCIVMFIPLTCGIVRVLCKRYLSENGDNDNISLNFWYYGFFLMLVYLSFKTLFMYVSLIVSLVLSFTVLSLLLGYLIKTV